MATPAASAGLPVRDADHQHAPLELVASPCRLCRGQFDVLHLDAPRRGRLSPAPIRRATRWLGTARPMPPATIALMPTTRPVGVRQRSAGVARTQPDIGHHQFAAAAPLRLAVRVAHHTDRQGAADAEGMAHRQHQFAGPQGARITDGGRC